MNQLLFFLFFGIFFPYKNHESASINEEIVTPMQFSPYYSVNLVFLQELENQLCDYVITASKLHHDLTRLMVQKVDLKWQ